jgi:hypothetical protein
MPAQQEASGANHKDADKSQQDRVVHIHLSGFRLTTKITDERRSVTPESQPDERAAHSVHRFVDRISNSLTSSFAFCWPQQCEMRHLERKAHWCN